MLQEEQHRIRQLHDSNEAPTDEDIQFLDYIISNIDSGKCRVSEKNGDSWEANIHAKLAVIMYLRYSGYVFSHNNYIFKIRSKFDTWTDKDFYKKNIRICPPAHVKYGSYIGDNCVIMPSFVNVGAYVGANSMIDTWATVGSCAQIGENVHISGGAGIGGVLEPAQASPTIIEDNCFIGSRAAIVEGVVIKSGAVISMGVSISQSTKIICRETKKIYQGYVPENAVVISGSLKIDDDISVSCGVIMKYKDERTASKTAINKLLRDVNHSKNIKITD